MNMLASIRAERKRTVSSAPAGMNFVRRLIALAAGKNEMGAAAEIARERWGTKSTVARYFEKANVPAGTVGGGWSTDIVQTPPDAAEFFAAADARSIPGQLPGLRRVPFFTAGLGIVSGSNVGWVKEGSAAPVAAPVFYKQAALAAFKLAAINVLTSELLLSADPRIEAVIRADLLNAAAYGINAAFIDPSNTGVANTKPASITSTQGSADSPAPTYTDAGDIVEGLLSGQDFAGDLERSVIIMHPATGARMTSAARPNVGARGGELSGFPAVVSSACPTDIVVLVDPTAVMFASENDGEISVSAEGTMELTDSPTNASGPAGSVVATSMVSLFQSNAVAIKITRRANWAMAKPNCVSYVSISIG